MRKNRFILIFAAFFLLAQMPQAFAAAAEGTIGRKFQRGVANVALSPMELSSAIYREGPQKGFFPNIVTGVFKGTALSVRRALVGVYEVLTAPIPTYQPIIRPEFPSQLLDDSKN